MGPRMHISGGAVGGGKMVADGAGITILDTSAGVWATQSAQTSAADSASLPEWAKRCSLMLAYKCRTIDKVFWFRPQCAGQGAVPPAVGTCQL